MARVAQREGLADVLADELEASAPGIAKRLRSALPDMPSKAYRWVAEMEERPAASPDQRQLARCSAR
jgi:Domain of unknown function (DUF1932)